MPGALDTAFTRQSLYRSATALPALPSYARLSTPIDSLAGLTRDETRLRHALCPLYPHYETYGIDKSEHLLGAQRPVE